MPYLQRRPVQQSQTNRSSIARLCATVANIPLLHSGSVQQFFILSLRASLSLIIHMGQAVTTEISMRAQMFYLFFNAASVCLTTAACAAAPTRPVYNSPPATLFFIFPTHPWHPAQAATAHVILFILSVLIICKLSQFPNQGVFTRWARSITAGSCLPYVVDAS
jgi:hypothetical protein